MVVLEVVAEGVVVVVVAIVVLLSYHCDIRGRPRRCKVVQGSLDPPRAMASGHALVAHHALTARDALEAQHALGAHVLEGIATRTRESRYQVVGELGAGSFGQVSLAIDLMTNRRVAIKQQLMPSEEAVRELSAYTTFLHVPTGMC